MWWEITSALQASPDWPQPNGPVGPVGQEGLEPRCKFTEWLQKATAMTDSPQAQGQDPNPIKRLIHLLLFLYCCAHLKDLEVKELLWG